MIKLELFHVLFKHLHHATLKEIFVEIAERTVTEKERELKKITGLDRFELEFKINDLIEAIVLIKSELGDGDKVNRYFYKHYKETDAEESLFTLLNLILDRQTP